MTNLRAVQEFTLNSITSSLSALVAEASIRHNIGSLLSEQLSIWPEYNTTKELSWRRLVVVDSDQDEFRKPSSVLREAEELGYTPCSTTDIFRLLRHPEFIPRHRHVFLHRPFLIPQPSKPTKGRQYATMLDRDDTLKCVRWHGKFFVTARNADFLPTLCVVRAP